MSVSEDNVLALLSKHPHLNDPARHARVIKGDCGGNSSSGSVRNNRGTAAAVLKESRSNTSQGGGDGGGVQGARAWWDPSGAAAASQASRNKFVIRWVFSGFGLCVTQT